MKTASDVFINQEVSDESAPAELFRIWTPSGGQEWTYTSADGAIVYGGKTYAPAPIKRGAVSYDSGVDAQSLDITISSISDPAAQYAASHPVEEIWVQVMRVHMGQSPLEALVVFAGVILPATIKGAAAKFQCVGMKHALRQQLPKWRIQPGCNVSVFSDKCALDPDDHKISGTLDAASIDGLTLSASEFSAQDDGYYTLGHILVNGHRRMIVEHSGSTVRLRYPIPGVAAADAFSAWPGCDGAIETCRDKFNNVANFRGYPDLPTDNPSTWSGS